MEAVIKATKNVMKRMPVMIAIAILLAAAVGVLMIYMGLAVEGSLAVAAIGAYFVGFAVWVFFSY